MGHHRLKAAAGASPADPYFSSTSLLLLGNGTNGGQNNTFVDGSTNNFTITRNGNTTQGSFSPFSAPDGRWSNFFSNNTDRLTVAAASSQTLSGNFTVEAWFYASANVAGFQQIIGRWSGLGQEYLLNLNATNKIQWYWSPFSSGAPFVETANNVYSINQWNHVAVVRSGGTHTIYVNGVSVATGTNAGNPSYFSSNPIYIASYQDDSTLSFRGYISNLRVVNGTAVYNSAFTPSTSPLTAITNTSLLTCQSNRFKDNSSNAFTITPSGNAAVTSFSPFAPLAEYSAVSNGGSGYFDGNGDYLTVANGAGLQLGSGNFTIEFWFYAFNFNTDYFFLIGNSGSSNENNYSYVFASNGSKQMVYALSSNGTSWNLLNTSMGIELTANNWNHIALVRNGSSILPYVNGVLGTTQTISASLYSLTSPVYIGSVANLYSYFPGYISNMRILKGTALYTSTFTPPTSPLTAITNTSLLLNFTNASIIDSTAKNDLETVGDAQVSTSVKKFGTGSLKFDGTGDYLKAPNNSNFQMGSGSFTIEMWLYTPSLPSAYKRVFGTTAPTISAATDEGINLEITNTNKMSGTCVVGSTYYSVTDTTDIPTSTWTHWALVRNGSTLTLYRDGTSVSTTSISGTSNWSTTFDAYVGRWVGSSARDYNGYIDDLRITKGVARYTSNFTPPSAQLPAR